MVGPGTGGVELEVYLPVAEGAAALVEALHGQGEVVMRVGIFQGHEADGGLVGLDGFSEALEAIEDVAEVEEGERVVWVGLDGLTVHALSALNSPRL